MPVIQAQSIPNQVHLVSRMSLSVGDKLGPYEILARIGAGGMGEVYRAHDPRMRRDVAIKISDKRFSDRFSREVHAVAALNHPNICHLYDVGPDYLVMELVEGSTLAERIKQGALPLDEALRIARQIADALEAAHNRASSTAISSRPTVWQTSIAVLWSADPGWNQQ